MMEAEIKVKAKTNQLIKESVKEELLLANGQSVNVQTSIRQAFKDKNSTFVSINTGCFRIKVFQRISPDNQTPQNAQIGFSKTSETDNLATILTLSLSLIEAIKIAEELNEKVPETEITLC